MGKVTKKGPNKSNNTPLNGQTKRRKGRPPKVKYVQQIDSSDEDSLRHASTPRPRMISIRRNEIPMRPEIHIPPTPISSTSNVQRQAPLQQNESQPSSATTSSRITITMTSVTTNSAEHSNTTTYVTTEILPVNEVADFPQPVIVEDQQRATYEEGKREYE